MKNIELKEKLFMNLFKDNKITLKHNADTMFKTSVCWNESCMDCLNLNMCQDRTLHLFSQEELDYILEKYPEARVVV